MMHRKESITAALGVLGVLFSLVAYLSDVGEPMRTLAVWGGIALFLWAAASLYGARRSLWAHAEDMEPAGGRRRITQADLLNEEDTVVASWDLYQKVSAVIGRDYKENHVDIDLGSSTYSSLVDVEHAVLNYADGAWYVEDLGSKNGVIVQKAADGRKYKLSPEQPCRLEPGDLLLIGLNRLKLH